jgi:fatty acid synthase
VLQVEVSKLDVADMEEAKGVVALAEKQAPVGGIFHLAMILQDRWMANQVWPLADCLYLLVIPGLAPQ